MRRQVGVRAGDAARPGSRRRRPRCGADAATVPGTVDREAALRAGLARRVRGRHPRTMLRRRSAASPIRSCRRACRAASSPSMSLIDRDGHGRRRGSALAARDQGRHQHQGPHVRRRRGDRRSRRPPRRASGSRARSTCRASSTDDGDVSIIEVNPRVSGGLSLTQAAGADVVGELVRGTRRRAGAPGAPALRGRRHDAPLLRRGVLVSRAGSCRSGPGPRS